MSTKKNSSGPANGHPSSSNPRGDRGGGGGVLWIFTHAIVMGAAFWFGAEYGTRFTAVTSGGSFLLCQEEDGFAAPQAKNVLEQPGRGSSHSGALRATQEEEEEEGSGGPFSENNKGANFAQEDAAAADAPPVRPWILPEEVQDFIGGIARVNRQSFLKTFDDGLPSEDDTPGNQEVLVFYDSKGSLPNSFKENMQPFETASEAMENCRYMRVMSVSPDRDDPVCLAIQGNNAEPHYFVHKWLQNPADGTYHQVSRYQTTLDKSNVQAFKKQAIMAEPPKPVIVNAANRILQQYLTNFNAVTEALKKVLAEVAKDNTVVAVVCSAGHVDLLRNFVCAARQRNALPDNMVVVSMDEDTHNVVSNELKLTSFYHPLLFAPIQAQMASLGDEAAEYGSGEYAHVMLAKLFVPHLITDAGYNLLFHDVDMVPFQDYYAHMVRTVVPRYPGFELFLSYDFTTDDMYAPWGANSGLWYARNTDKTRYFFSLLVRRVALVLKTKSHQAAMSVVMSDVANHYGLRVKVLDKHGPEFPGAYASRAACAWGCFVCVSLSHSPTS
jgi:Nucleotide-diphospho-sugar transferase